MGVLAPGGVFWTGRGQQDRGRGIGSGGRDGGRGQGGRDGGQGGGGRRQGKGGAGQGDRGRGQGAKGEGQGAGDFKSKHIGMPDQDYSQPTLIYVSVHAWVAGICKYVRS